MRGVLILIAAVFTWAALYQGIVAFGAPAVRDDELVQVAGVVRHVDTPLMRNRRVEQAVLQIETAPARHVMVPIPLAALPLDEVRRLVGQPITVLYAALRPRNRWIYDLKTATEHRVRLSEQRQRDADLRASHVRWMLGLAAMAMAAFGLAFARFGKRDGID